VTFLSDPTGSNVSSDYQLADIYVGLRHQVLALKRADLKLGAGSVWGVLMETGYEKAVMTLVVLADRTVSLYFSNGGGIIGLGQHDGPRRVASALLELAPQFSTICEPVTEFPLPRKRNTRFYLMASETTLTAEALEADLRHNRLALSPLFHRCHELITEIRKVDETLRTQRSAQPGAAPKAT
jgi:hypothetical protein